MIVERPGLEGRVLASLDAGRIPVLLGGCAIGRTSLLLRLHRSRIPAASKRFSKEAATGAPCRASG
mgnify:CR=1 FL=1